jgi:hypothetical protein
MGDVLRGLALFFCMIFAVSAYNRYYEAKEKAEVVAEQEKQQRKWEEEYLKSQESTLQQPDTA